MDASDREWFVADFETTSYETYLEEGCTRVWLYAICNSQSEVVKWGDTIDDFMEYIKTINKPLIYFHNLKFDGSFIIHWLLRNNFKYKEKITLRSNKGFSCLIGEEGQFYQITINFAHDKQVIIQDSLKLIPLKVKEIAKAFNLEIEKEKIDYSNYEINDETLHYVFNDVKIVAKALAFFRSNGFNKMTIGANSYNIFKDSCPLFNSLFPNLSEEWLLEWRDAYRGGRSQVNPIYQGQILHNVRRYDINSMYPYTMAKFPMPYGKPIPITKRGRYKFELYKINVSFKLKEGHLPTLLKKGAMFGNNDTYYINTDLVETIYISNIDLDLLYRHYDITFIEYVEMYGFKTSCVIFEDFINEFYALKNASTGGMKLLYKLIINNLYGKFGSKCRGSTKIPMLDDNSEITFDLSDEKSMRKYYLPVAIQVCSVAHLLIDNAIMLTGYNNFVYCDTDSVHTLGTLPNELVDNKELGKFKLEGIEDTAKYIRQKCYVHKQGDVYTITCSGMTDGIKDYLVEKYKDDIFYKFEIGLKVDENSEGIKREQLKLRPMQVNGGVVLKPVPFSIH